MSNFFNASGYYDPTAGQAIMRVDGMQKYRNKKTVIDGILFDSKKEADRYRELKLLQRAGLIENLQRQTRFELLPKTADERAIYYRSDFTYIEDGKQVVEDVKGVKTRDYVLKRKLFKSRYPDIVFRETSSKQ